MRSLTKSRRSDGPASFGTEVTGEGNVHSMAPHGSDRKRGANHPWRWLAPTVVLVASVLTAASIDAGRAGSELRRAPTSEAIATVARPARGLVRSTRQMSFATDLAARVDRIAKREGERFAKGEPLIIFDCRRHRAELASLEATVAEMDVLLQSQMHLVRVGATNRNDLEVARARLAKATADARALQARLEQCEVAAPFDGSVYELAINQHELPQAGRPFLTIVGSDDLEVELIISSHALRWLSVGSRLDFLVDETARHYPIAIARLASAVDPVSQTVKVYARFSAAHADVLAGMSGEARAVLEPSGDNEIQTGHAASRSR